MHSPPALTSGLEAADISVAALPTARKRKAGVVRKTPSASSWRHQVETRLCERTVIIFAKCHDSAFDWFLTCRRKEMRLAVKNGIKSGKGVIERGGLFIYKIINNSTVSIFSLFGFFPLKHS